MEHLWQNSLFFPNESKHYHVGTQLNTIAKGKTIILHITFSIVVAVFGVCWAPFHIERFLWSSISQWTDLMYDIYQCVHIVSGILFYLSSAVNPVIYNLLSTRFRQGFRELVCSQTEDNPSVKGSPPFPKVLCDTPSPRSQVEEMPSRPCFLLTQP